MKNLLAIVVLLLIAVQLWAAPASGQILCDSLYVSACAPLPTYPTPQQRLEMLGWELSYLRIKLSDDHPDLVRLRATIKAYETLIEAGGGRFIPIPWVHLITPAHSATTTDRAIELQKKLDKIKKNSLPICQEPPMECRLRSEAYEREIEASMGKVIPIPPVGP